MGALAEYAASITEEFHDLDREFTHGMDESCKQWNDGVGISYRNNVVRRIADMCCNAKTSWYGVESLTAQIEAFIDAILDDKR